jgi:hypothetical protein
MLHLWLFPALAVLALFVLGLYYVLHRHGGDGVRREGQCVLNRDEEAEVGESSGPRQGADYLFIRTPPGYQAIRWTQEQEQKESSGNAPVR